MILPDPKNTTLTFQIVVTGRDGGEGRAAGQLQLPGGAGEGQDHGGHHGPHPQVSQDPRHILRQREVSRTRGRDRRKAMSGFDNHEK